MSEKTLVWLICLGLALATLGTFWRVTTYSFLDYDDQDYVTENPQVQAGLTLRSLSWALTHTVSGNWHPLTMLSHMLDCSLFGLNAGMHHLTNLLLHTANVLLLFLVLRRLTGAVWPCAFVAALFGLHPLHVESVAWVAERKDVLSAFFFMLTLWAYARYVEQSKAQGPKSMGLSPKPKVQSLESTNRRPGAEVAAPVAGTDTAKPSIQAGDADFAIKNQKSKIKNSPTLHYGLALVFFALGLMSKPMLVTLPFVLLLLDYWPLGRFRELSVAAGGSPIIDRRLPITNHLRSLGRLAIEKLPFFLLTVASSVVALLAQKHQGAMAPLGMFSVRARLGNAAVAYLVYLEKMVWPTRLGILYLRPLPGWPSWQIILGLVVIAVMSAWAMLAVVRGRRPYLTVGWFWYLGMLVPVIGLVQVGSQAFANRYTYLPLIGCFIILAWGGAELVQRFRVPRNPVLGVAILMVVAIGALTYREANFWSDSETLFRRCLVVTSDNYMAHNGLAATAGARGRFEEARGHLVEALRIYPQYASALQNMGALLAMHGDFDQAKTYLSEAVRLDPQTALVYGKLGFVLSSRGENQPAVGFYREFLRLKPDDEKACNNLAWILATNPDPTLRNGPESVRWAEHGCELTHYKETVFVGTLAAAYAEAGRFQEAVAAAERAIELAHLAGQRDLERKNLQLLDLYRAGKAYHEEK
ncbi:MAG TPA: tetratricopeptide repeat protein [Candidatus Acidoferrum sp.]|nr:tetratricopeptide repeat protein [Candidatus Acidoferrum sp.]